MKSLELRYVLCRRQVFGRELSASGRLKWGSEHTQVGTVIAFGGHATAPELRLRRLYSLLGMQKPSLTPDVTIADVISQLDDREAYVCEVFANMHDLKRRRRRRTIHRAPKPSGWPN